MDEAERLKMAGYALALRERSRRDRRALDARRREAQALAHRLGRVLRDRFGAAEVFLFGSTATGKHYRFDSDIDLAVTGIPAEREIRVCSEISLLAGPGFGVDLLFMESAAPIFRDRVREEGRFLGQRE